MEFSCFSFKSSFCLAQEPFFVFVHMNGKRNGLFLSFSFLFRIHSKFIKGFGSFFSVFLLLRMTNVYPMLKNEHQLVEGTKSPSCSDLYKLISLETLF